MVPTNHRRELAGALQTDALQGVRDFCAGKWDPEVAGKPYCARLHNATGLPTGAAFNEAVFRMLTTGEGTVRSPPASPALLRLHALPGQSRGGRLWVVLTTAHT